MKRTNMKTNQKIFGTLLLLCLLIFNVRAVVLFQDDFNSYASGTLPTNGTPWSLVSGNGSGVLVDGSVLYNGQTFSDDVKANLTGQPYTNVLNGTNIFYASYTVNFQALPTANGGYYFAHFTTVGGFKARMHCSTNGAGINKFRLGISNGANTNSAMFPLDLSPGSTYTVVIRYFNPTNTFATPASTLWIDPANELSTSVTATDSTTASTVQAYGFREPGSSTTPTTGAATMKIDNLFVGTTFADVVASSVNPPSLLLQPQDTNIFLGSTAIFTTQGAGDPTISYKWYYNTNTLFVDSVPNGVSGSTSNILVLTPISTAASGTISCVVSNNAGTNVTRYAALTVSALPIPPTITNQPVGSTNSVGETVTFTVVAGGLPPPAYQWNVVPDTNTMVTNIIAGATSATLTLSNLSTNQSGSYFVTLTNTAGYMVTNSALAVLKVNPPPVLTIAQFRAKVDGSFAPTNTTAIYTIQGTVTTWTNMTTSSANTQFYMQDNTGGIAVFWSGAPKSTNIPPAGAVVQVTGPMAAFNGLIEIQPFFTNALHSVTVLSTGNPLPAPQPLPFDPAISNTLATMKAMESMYFVASNVTLTAGTTFSGGVNEAITVNANQTNTFSNSTMTFTFTNTAGQIFTLFINAATDIPGKAKPSGPVTIYGVLGYFTSAGFELIPSRYEDIISYVRQTNVLSNLVRQGDLPTNSFAENFLLPGATLTTYVSIGDPAGGIVTLTPITTGLPASAYWDGVTSGQNASAVFHFTPATGDASSNYVVSITAASTSGSTFTNTFSVYVPTPDEQKVEITEFLANPTTNTAWANFNPLKRSSPTTGISTNDQYFEVVNLSVNGLGSGWTVDKGNTLAPIFDSNGGGVGIASSNAVVIYGGGSPAPGVPNAYNTSSLRLPTSGTGVIILRNQYGYILDRVIYDAAKLSTNSSLSRFPTVNGPFVPQAYISTNATTAGYQYDGGLWSLPTKVPTGVTNSVVTIVNNQAVIIFTADITLASTLWSASAVQGPYQVIFGQQFFTTSGVFNVTNLPPITQFYFITTQ
jgi:hypothetical protein